MVKKTYAKILLEEADQAELDQTTEFLENLLQLKEEKKHKLWFTAEEVFRITSNMTSRMKARRERLAKR